MTHQQYDRLFRWLQERPGLAEWVRRLTKGLPLLFAFCYIGICGWLVLTRDIRVWRFMGVPAVILALVLFLRRSLNISRPYEVYGFQPLISREKGGQSCPSNHTASAFSIALALLYLWVPAGAVALAMAAILGVSRIVTGVHWPRDVAVGAVLGVLLGFVGFWVL